MMGLCSFGDLEVEGCGAYFGQCLLVDVCY